MDCILPDQISGRAYAPMSSHQFQAKLVIRSKSDPGADNTVELTNEAGAIVSTAVVSDIKVEAPLGKQPRRLTFPDGAMFETGAHQKVEQLFGKDRLGWLHKLEAFHPRLIGIVLACGFAVWLIYRFGLDVLVAGAIALTPPLVVEQIDRGTLQAIDFQMAKPSTLSAEEKARVEDIFAKLLPHIATVPDGTGFQLLFRSMPGVGPNAFALPGGTVVMTDQFVKKFPEDDILASVLGHEIGHVVERHGLRQVYRSLTTYILVALIAGETGPLLEDVLLEGNLLLSLSYSRQHETSADRFGVGLANRAGFNPNGLRSFFERMAKTGGQPPQWLSTHPNSKDRVTSINGFIQELNR